MRSLEQIDQEEINFKGFAENHAQMEAAALMLQYGSFEEIPPDVLVEWIGKHSDDFNKRVREDMALDRRIIEEEKRDGHLSLTTLQEVVSRLIH